jgi:hypothetical protein
MGMGASAALVFAIYLHHFHCQDSCYLINENIQPSSANSDPANLFRFFIQKMSDGKEENREFRFPFYF